MMALHPDEQQAAAQDFPEEELTPGLRQMNLSMQSSQGYSHTLQMRPLHTARCLST